MSKVMIKFQTSMCDKLDVLKYGSDEDIRSLFIKEFISKCAISKSELIYSIVCKTCISWFRMFPYMSDIDEGKSFSIRIALYSDDVGKLENYLKIKKLGEMIVDENTI